MRNVVEDLHAGGVEYVVTFPNADQFKRAVERLLVCHDHVFVVDQSHGRSLGVSRNGLICLTTEFQDMPWPHD